jgi:16S rRNA (cytosine1402-N4)-methyltransferase
VTDHRLGATHVPVLRDRIVELLAPALREPGALVVDGTLGLGGHAEALLRACPEARLLGLDRDPDALAIATARLAPFGDRAQLVHATSDRMAAVANDLGADTVRGVLLDLGVSSLQLDRPERGFAYAHDAPLDMRMDPSTGPTAADVLNDYDEAAIAQVLRDYGEERFARRIARAVVAERRRTPFTTSARLVALVREAVPAATRRTGGNPAKRTFQALRIEVNGELAQLERMLPAALGLLAVGGRIAVLSYHSLEDRLVKRAFAAEATSRTPADLPVELPELAPTLRVLTRGAERPDEAEVAANPRAASARLRAAERLSPLAAPLPGGRAA